MNCKMAKLKIDECIKANALSLPHEVEAHLISCAQCSAYRSELAGLQSILDKSDMSVYPGELDDITFESITAVASGKGREIKAGSRKAVYRWLWAPAAIAATIIVTVLVPQLANRVPSGSSAETAIVAPTSITSVEVISDIARSDSLGDEVLADIAQDIDMDYIADALLEGSDVSDMLYGLTPSEMEALYNKIDNLSETGSTGKG